jgi:hypothetical protein
MKYRVKYTGNPKYPYRAERKAKSWYFWTTIGAADTQSEAEKLIKRRINMPAYGDIVFEFSEEDIVVEKLKGVK